MARIKLRLPQFREHTDSALQETLVEFLHKKGMKEDSVDSEDHHMRTEEYVVTNAEQY